MDLMTRRRILLAQSAQESGILATATGNPMSFVTDIARPLHVMTIPFTPKTDSSGWTGAIITRSGKNLFDKASVIPGYYFNRSGGLTQNASYSIAYIKVNPGDKVIYSGLKGANGSPCGIQFFDNDKNFVSMNNPDAQNNNTVAIVPNGASYIGISVFSSANVNYRDINTAQIEFGMVASEYEEYYGQTIQIVWQSSSGTAYTGILTLNADGSADLSADGNNYHLANVGQITTLIGTNNIWSDTNGINTAQYWIQNT